MKDEWLCAAISDDALVADLLLRLRDFSNSDSSHPSVILRPTKALPPTWGVRQPRSKSQSPEKKEAPRSPTTPLSWAGGASPSEGCEESSSHPPPSDRFRSKISVTTGTPTTTRKRPRRKKTFVELKEEEGSLLKEQTYLKKKLDTLRLTLMEHRSMNEKLKRMKLDLRVESGVKSETNPQEPNKQNMTHNQATCEAITSMSRQVKCEPEPESCSQRQVTESDDAGFVLPDLNVIPDDDSVQKVAMS